MPHPVTLKTIIGKAVQSINPDIFSLGGAVSRLNAQSNDRHHPPRGTETSTYVLWMESTLTHGRVHAVVGRLRPFQLAEEKS